MTAPDPIQSRDKAAARMTPADPPTTTDTQTAGVTAAVECCMHRDRDERGCWDCRNTGHAHDPAEPCQTAPEPTPLERAAEAVRNMVADDAEVQAQEIVTALLSGDWLERVLGEHSDFAYVNADVVEDHFECDCGHEFGYEADSHAEWAAHLAAAVRTAAGVGL